MALMDEALGDDEENELDSTSDRLFDESFGKGQFSPNEFGGRTFTPADNLVQQALQSPPAQESQAIFRGKDPTTGTPYYSNTIPKWATPEEIKAFRLEQQKELERSSKGEQPPNSFTGRPTASNIPSSGGGGEQEVPRAQITNLQQLGQVMQNLKNVPPEMRDRILKHLLGIPYQDPRQAAIQNAIALAQAKHQITQPERTQGMDLRQMAEERRKEALQQREEYQKILVKLRQRSQKSIEEQRQEALKQHQETAKTQLANSIANLTRAMTQAVGNPEQQNEIAKVLLKQQKLYHQLADFGDERQQAEVENAGGEANDSQGSAY